ncbi:hypothetical protein [Streptomyces sp. Ac-502]|uniref:hypothetical protein n=1 Tax=Streptomyces sp. Ac-502 TaxID=3342801 RepID=UPI003862CB2E
MTKKKSGSKDKTLTEQADETVGAERPPETVEAGLVLTADPQAPAVRARKKLLKAIAGEATAISKAKKGRGRSCKALNDLARAYALVAAEETRSGPAASANSGNGSRKFLPSMRTVFLAKGSRGRKGGHDGG